MRTAPLMVNPQTVPQEPDEVFAHHYESNYWGGSESRSGRGSNLEQTQVLRQELPTLLQQLAVTSILDIPCGDLHWLSQTPLKLERYLGGDIVPEIIERNREALPSLFGARTEYQVLNIATSPLPLADAVFCRDCLVHLPNQDALAALANIKRSGALYLLATTFPLVKVNRDVKLGEWRPLNLCLPPFYLPTPIDLVLEGCTEDDGLFADKSLGVWRCADLP